jgi:hypothetical protein
MPGFAVWPAAYGLPSCVCFALSRLGVSCGCVAVAWVGEGLV